MDSNCMPRWRYRKRICRSKIHGHDILMNNSDSAGQHEDGEKEKIHDNSEKEIELDDIIYSLQNGDACRMKWSNNLTDKVTDEDTEEEKLIYFLADFLKIKDEGNVSDKTASRILNLIASFLPKGKKFPRSIQGCRAIVRNKVPQIVSIFEEAEEQQCDEGRVLVMPVNKNVKNVVKRNMNYLLPQINDDGVIDIKLQLHTDGVEIAKSSKVKMWPLSAIVENLPGKVRVNKNNVILIAIHVSKKMPDFNLFCRRFVNDFNSGIQAVLYDVNDNIVQKRTAKIRVSCNMLTGDIPAIRSILNLQGHNCQFGCIHCYCESVTETSIFGNGRKRTYASSEAYALRTNDSYLRDLNQLTAAGVSSFYGVKGVSHLSNLIKVPEDVAIDYFHSVLLGPFKEDITRIVFGFMSLSKSNSVVKIPGFIDRQYCHFKQSIEMSIFPSEFKRKMKPLTEIDNYKGIEWKNLMLYAMPTIMSDICNGDSKPLYLVNLCLANAVIVLMKDNVSALEIKKSQEQLYEWYMQRTAILGNEAMTLKAHQMTHLAEIVQRHGNLCQYSCFFGEGLGYNLTRLISLKTVDKSLSQLKTRLTDYSAINAIVEQKESKKKPGDRSIETRMCVRDYCHRHYDNFSLEVQELGEYNLKSYIFKPAYNLPFTKDSFLAYECDQAEFKCGVGIVKSIVSVGDDILFILRPVKIKSTLFDKFPVNSNETVINRIKDNTMFDYYFCLEEYMAKEEMTSYRPMNLFVNETSHLLVINESAIIYKCLVINTPGRKSYCCPIIAPFEHN